MFSKPAIQSFQHLETPFYYYDLALLQNTLITLTKYSQQYDYKIHYALKANPRFEILRPIQKAGLGADCVSGNEVKRAIEAGFSAHHIAFAGVGKTDKEIEVGLQHNIFSFNCESVEELEVINTLAAKNGKIANIALRINPNIVAATHKYISTGSEENKFGINISDLGLVIQKLQGFTNLVLTGIHFHIGSQILDLDNFKNLCLRANELQKFFEEQQIALQHINVGGGLGINYKNPDTEPIANFESYFATFHKYLQRRPQQEVHFELGRAIVGQCGSLITKVLFVKQGEAKKFVILDAGMTELIRPALYQAYHHVENLTANTTQQEIYDVVGPICESSDCFVKDMTLPTTQRGDLITLRSAGAYGEVMASNYNLREKIQAVFSDNHNSF
jgi:diaminopimelate decarboxylase